MEISRKGNEPDDDLLEDGLTPIDQWPIRCDTYYVHPINWTAEERQAWRDKRIEQIIDSLRILHRKYDSLSQVLDRLDAERREP